ncbi:MAG: hypothetical protein ACRDTH_03215 [Pseudonocardiaceae bacterium]
MNESEHVEMVLPMLSCIDEPRGGAVVWALLVVVMTLAVGILLVVIWAAGAAW